tara:strand:+ start:2152 stop:4782 length:2631 start_codon:yes stop_codon:yes gene_type:complete
MFIAILTLLSALSISGVAIFYSVIGLATIFPGAFWPVVIMGSVLEVGKLVTASWLYRNWRQTRFLLKTYLTIAVVVLSLITSMGIFGFLSKAHLEQNLAENTVNQRIDIINSKIVSEETYIKRQLKIIERAEKTLSKTGTSNKEALDLEQQSLKDVQDKFKTLLAVETNTVKDLNDRLKVLDKDVSDVLTSNKSFFNEEKAAADLKASQKEERADINKNISNAQARIKILKDDYAVDTAVIQKRIDKLREGNIDDKSEVNAQIEVAEANILKAQNDIDDLIIDREPLEAKMIKLEAEVGPVKYIASLVVDWGITKDVDTSEAVRWVILIIICVFDPLAVLLLVAANQSLIRKFPVEPIKPQEIVDLEKPDDEGIDLKWNAVMDKQNSAERMEQATQQLKEWKEKLDAFNAKVPKPEDRPVEIIQEDPQKKTEDKEIVADNLKDGFDPAEVEGYDEFNKKYEGKTPDPADVIKAIKREEEEEKQEQIERFKKREEEERKALEEYSRKAREDEQEHLYEQSISEQIEEAMEPERLKPDFTEVLEPETPLNESDKKQPSLGMIGVRPVDKKGKVVPAPKTEMTDEERTALLNKFHQEHGKFEDISADELKIERDESNRAQFLADVSLSKEEAEKQGPITESRMAFFEDMIDEILRGDVTFENVPVEHRKILAQIMDPELDNPQIITKGSALKEQTPEGIEEINAEGLKEKFMVEPKTEERPMTDEELDALLEGWDEEQKPTGKKKMIIKDGQRIFVPVEDKTEYVQNEEQSDDTLWQKTKELDIPEPEKNEIILPKLENTVEDVPEIVESLDIEQKIADDKFQKYRKRLTSEEDYHQRIEARINDLITRLENKEIKLSDLSDEDQKVIIDILNQNDGSN